MQVQKDQYLLQVTDCSGLKAFSCTAQLSLPHTKIQEWTRDKLKKIIYIPISCKSMPKKPLQTKKKIFKETKQFLEVQGDTQVCAPQTLAAPNKPKGSPSWFKAL